ncbi:MAG: acetyl-CoA carboxylase biotin carboxyl carrier protein subunit [Candidatus Daviesbacteria bacterium]|nr:acetyl-CoA carboxylase biotin carboxyl carrier protein subunit [Candidatus Daviesbacteria bacterium]
MAGKEAPWLIDLRKTLKTMRDTNADYLVADDGYNKTVIRRRSHTSVPKGFSPEEDLPNYENETRYSQIKAPFTGVLYRRPEPEKPYYVNEGDFVEEGQIVAMIEAMKLVNVIEATRSGQVIKIFCQDGTTVNKDDILMVLNLTKIPMQNH